MVTFSRPSECGTIFVRFLGYSTRWDNAYTLLHQLARYRATAVQAYALIDAMQTRFRQLEFATPRANSSALPLHIRERAEADVADAEARLDALAADAVRLARGE